MGRRSETQFSGDAKAQASEFAAPSRSLTVKAIVLAAVLALIGAIALVGALGRDANAFTPYSAGDNGNGGKPTVTATMSKPDSYPVDNKRFNYKGKVVFSEIEPGVKGAYKLEVTSDENAPFTSTEPRDFAAMLTVSGGRINGDPVLSNNGRTVTYELVPSAVSTKIEADFTGEGKLKNDLDDATVVYGSINGSFIPTTQVSVKEEESPHFDYPFQCTGTANFKYKVPDGGYLMDIKFADAKGDGGIIYSGGEPSSDGESNDSITFTKPSGEVVKLPNSEGERKNVLELGGYKRVDTTPPYYGEADPLLQKEENKNAKWIDSYNWKYDPKYSTGDTWLPAGTIITIKRQVTFRNCNNGIATDGNVDRNNTIISVVEVGKNAVPVSDGATTAFVTPGEPEQVDSCHDLWLVETGKPASNGTGGEANRVGYLEDVPEKNTFKDKGEYLDEGGYSRSDSLAISDKTTFLQGKAWYQGGKSGRNIYYKEYNKAGYPYQKFSASYTGRNLRRIAGALAFSQNGDLYAFSERSKDGVFAPETVRMYRLKLSDVTEDNKDNGLNWEPGIDITGNAFGDVKDFAFNKNGDLLVLTNRDNRSFLTKIPKAKVNSQSGEFNPSPIELLDRGKAVNELWGIAYGKDGQLYVGSTVNGLYQVDVSSGRLNKVKDSPKAIGDLASCNFGENNTEGSVSPIYKVEKRAVNPTDGSVTAAGGSVPDTDAVELKSGKVTVEYVVSVSNTGGKAGDPGNVTDTFTVPAGMTLDDAEIENANGNSNDAVDWTRDGSSFTISNVGEIENNSVKSYRVRLNLTVTDLGAVENNRTSTKCDGSNNVRALGFLNTVKIKGDEGEPDNKACIPGIVPKTQKLRLAKKIVDRNGSEYTSAGSQKDADAFQVSAGNTKGNNDVFGITGEGKVPGSGFVTIPVGTYQLSETIVDGQEDRAGKYRPFKKPVIIGDNETESNWTCNRGLGANNTVTVTEDGGPTACFVYNIPKAYVQKLPFSAGTDNQFVSRDTYNLDSQGKVIVKYRVQVYTNAPQPLRVDSGPIFDQFKVPDGLVWDHGRTIPGTSGPGLAKISPVGRYANDPQQPSEATGVKTLVTEEELEKGVQIAENVSNLRSGPAEDGQPARYHYRFVVSIPLKVDNTDTTVGHGPQQTKFTDNEAKLAKCSLPSGKHENNYVNHDGGVVNNTYMSDEDTSYSDFWEKDNHACVPVVRTRQWNVEKNAKKGSGWESIGDSISPTSKAGKLRVNPEYRITATNKGPAADKQPQIHEKLLRLNGGYEIEKVNIYRAKFDDSGNEVKDRRVLIKTIKQDPDTEKKNVLKDVDIEPADGVIQPGKTVDYIVSVEGVLASEQTPSQREEVGTCTVSAGESSYEKGLFNRVSLDDEFGDDTSDNDACIPVTGSEQIIIQKFDSGDNPLAGAEFVIHPDGGNGPNSSSTIEVNKSDSDGSMFTSGDLTPGATYWLKETKAPAGGHELLPQPLKFKVVDGKIQIFSDGNAQPTEGTASADGGSFVVDYDTNALAIKVHDPRAMELPLSGGIGRWPIVALGVLVVVISMLYMVKTSGVSRRRD